jgi:phi13 family phage major tail protein
MAAPVKRSGTTIIGIDMGYFAPFLDEIAETYEEPFKLDPIAELSVEPEVNTASQYGDNIAIETASAMGAINATIAFTGLTPEIEAKLLGHTYVTADRRVIKAASDIAPLGAFLYRRMRADGGYRYKVLYRGRFSIPKEETKTKEDQIEFQNSELGAVFMPRLSDQVYDMSIDADKATPLVPDKWATKFFEKVLLPTETPTA